MNYIFHNFRISGIFFQESHNVQDGQLLTFLRTCPGFHQSNWIERNSDISLILMHNLVKMDQPSVVL